MNLFSKYKKTPEGTAVLTALSVGLVTHCFALVNILHNYDDIASLPGGYGIGVHLGRWLLEVMGQLAARAGLGYNLGLVDGLIFLLFLSVTAGFLASTLQLKKRSSAALVGALLVVFPTVSSTLFFRYTAPYYGVAILLAVLAVWVLRKNRFGLALSALCICCSMGIYQAYAPVTIGLFVIQLIQQALRGETDLRKLIQSGLYDCLALILGVVLYFVGLQVAVLFTGTELMAYQGVDSMGQLSLADIPRLIVQAYDSFFNIALQDYCGVSGRRLIQLTYCALGLVTAVMVVCVLVKGKKVSMAVGTAVLCILFPLAVNFIALMCPDGYIYTLMVYGFVLVGCLPVVVAECLPEGKMMAKLAGLLVAVLVFCYGYFDNVNYSALYYANRQAENYANSIVVQVRMTEGFTSDKQWAFIGRVDDPLLHSQWDEEVSYGGSGSARYLLRNYSRNDWISNYVGYTLPLAGAETIEKLQNTDEVKAMPCFPDAGSIRVIGDTVVIKFQELSK